MVSPTAAPTRKVTAGAAGGIVIGAPLAVVLIYVLEDIVHVKFPAEVVVALGSLISVACSFAASYIVPPSIGDIPVPAPKAVPK